MNIVTQFICNRVPCCYYGHPTIFTSLFHELVIYVPVYQAVIVSQPQFLNKEDNQNYDKGY